MPIGFDPGDLVAVLEDPAATDAAALAELARAEQAAIVVIWTRWQTAEDERVCPECGPLDGLAWPADEGPQPPLHRHCRCVREFAFVEFGARG